MSRSSRHIAKQTAGLAAAYRAIIAREFEVRTSANPSYSLRAYARDIGLAAPRLSLILNCKQGLSRAAAAKVAKRLRLTAADEERFSDLVEAAHARSPLKRSQARMRLEHQQPQDFREVNADAFAVVADWYHFAILELVGFRAYDGTLKWLARRSGLPLSTIKDVVARLQRLGLLVMDEAGRLQATEALTATTDGVPTTAIRKFHTQILRKAQDALSEQSVHERNVSVMFVKVSARDMINAAQLIKDFRRSFSKNLRSMAGSAPPTEEQLYSLGIQLFKLC